MKNTLIALICLVCMQSCTELAFKNAMPVSGENLQAFPKEFQGTFASTLEPGDTLVITATDVSGDKFHIGENNVLKKCGSYYVCNEKKANRWVLGLIRSNGKNGFSVYRFDVEDSKSKEAISKITPLEEVPDQNGGVDYLMVSPTDKEFRKMLRSRAFIRAEKFKRIR